MFPATTATLDTLPNGLSLILDPDPAAPVVSAQLWLETGSIHEGDQLGAGLSHFLEHMMFKGGGDFDATQLAESVPAAGGHWNAYTSFDRTVYFIDGPSSGLERFLEVLAAMVFHPHLPESEFEREKDVIRREIDMGLDDPDDRAHQLLFATAFSHDARRHPVIGHRDRFDAVSHEQLVDYHRRRYSPDRACLCLAGDFDPDAVRDRVAALFGGVARGGGGEPAVPLDPPQLGPRRARDRFAVPASRLTLAWKIPALGDPHLPALDLLAAILGRGRSARLYRELRERRSLALEINAWCWSQPGREGLFGISAETPEPKRDELVAAIHDEVRRCAEAEFGAPLERAKRQIAAAQFRTLTSSSGRAGDLASNWHEARDLDFTRRYLAQLEAVTAEDLRAALGSLDESRETLAVLDPLESAATTPRPARGGAKPEPETLTLPNGATLALLPDPRVPVLALQAAMRAGAPAETPATAGINRLLAATLPQATRQRPAEPLANTLESLGASLGAGAGNNSLALQLAGLSPDLATLVPIFGEVLAEPALEADSIEREKAAQLAELEEALEDPLSLAFRELRARLFGPAGYGIPSLGERESLTALGRLELAAHHSLHATGANLCLALAGDFAPAEARDALSAALAEIPAGETWSPPASKLRDPEIASLSIDKRQAALALGFPGLAALDPRRFALRMIQEWCSDMAGPLFTRIREQLGLAYQVGATQFHGHDTGLLAFYLATDPAQRELAERELRAEIAKLAEHGIPDAAFERVRATVISAVALHQQSPHSIARQAAIDLLFGLPATHHRDLARHYLALTPSEVLETARQLLGERDPVVVRVN